MNNCRITTSYEHTIFHKPANPALKPRPVHIYRKQIRFLTKDERLAEIAQKKEALGRFMKVPV